MPRDDDSAREPEPETVPDSDREPDVNPITEPKPEPEREPEPEPDSGETPDLAPTPPSVTLPAPLAPWWSAPLESPWAATATPIQRPQAAPLPVAPSPVAPPAAVSVAPALNPPVGNRPRAVQADDAAPVSAIRHANWRATPEPDTARRDRTPLIWSSIVVVAVIVLVSLFFAGQRFVGAANVAESSPTVEPTSEPTAEPTPSADVTAMATAGTHPWTAMYGGECLSSYESPWAEKFTVVDCGTPHSAQLVFRGQFASDPAAVFPGEAALAAQIPVLCTATDVINITAAAALADVQVQGSYPVTKAQWDAGQRQYYCFVSRSSAEPLTASLAA